MGEAQPTTTIKKVQRHGGPTRRRIRPAQSPRKIARHKISIGAKSRTIAWVLFKQVALTLVGAVVVLLGTAVLLGAIGLLVISIVS